MHIHVLQVGLLWHQRYFSWISRSNPSNLESPHLHHNLCLKSSYISLLLKTIFNLLRSVKICLICLSDYSIFPVQIALNKAAELHDRFHTMNRRLTVVLPVPVIRGWAGVSFFHFLILNFSQGCSRRKPFSCNTTILKFLGLQSTQYLKESLPRHLSCSCLASSWDAQRRMRLTAGVNIIKPIAENEGREYLLKRK